MSVREMTWAFGQRVGSPMGKLVLLALADRHNDETGADAFPMIGTIAAETEMNERSVRRHLEALEAAGLIACLARGRGRVYRLGPPADTGRRVRWRTAATGHSVIETSHRVRESGLSVHDTGQRVLRTSGNRFQPGKSSGEDAQARQPRNPPA